jgi:transglutaminase-like putative cysteine protease
MNFTYRNQRDGAVIDGTKRPSMNQIPDPVVALYDEDCRTIRIDGTHLQEAYAWMFLMMGEGVCDHWAATFHLMMNALGIENRVVTGQVGNANGQWIGHAWNALKIDGTWYFYDAQIEASGMTRSRNTTNPYNWFHQPTNTNRYQFDASQLQ